jgi:hypothetical protein
VDRTNFIKLVQCHVARVALSSSTLRNQGAPNVTTIARDYCAKVDLSIFVRSSEAEFVKALEKCTVELQYKFPEGARRWGTARKALNVFLRDCFYNTYLNKAFELGAVERYLEIPLDGIVGRFLCKKNSSLPKWTTIGNLSEEDSKAFQSYASQLAKAENICRVHLDVSIWGNRANM